MNKYQMIAIVFAVTVAFIVGIFLMNKKTVNIPSSSEGTMEKIMIEKNKPISDNAIKALTEAINILKDESSPSNNQVTFDKVVNLANELYSDKLLRNISPTSLKNPTSEDFINIKKTIEDYRVEYKKIKTAAPKKSMQEVSKLKIQVQINKNILILN